MNHVNIIMIHSNRIQTVKINNWLKEKLNIWKKKKKSKTTTRISAPFAVGHAALSVHHPSHSQHWRSAEGQEVHRGLWDGGLRHGAPPHHAPPLPNPSEGWNCSRQHSAHPSTAVPSCRLSSLCWVLGSPPLMDLKINDWSVPTRKEIMHFLLLMSQARVFESLEEVDQMLQ